MGEHVSSLVFTVRLSHEKPGYIATTATTTTTIHPSMKRTLPTPLPRPRNPFPHQPSTIAFPLHTILTALTALALLIHLVVIAAEPRGMHEACNLLIIALVILVSVVVHGAFGVVLEGGLVEEVAELVDAEAGEDAEDFTLVVVEF